MILNPYRFAAGVSLPTPLHWWDLDSLRGAGDGIIDKGSGNWGRLVNNGNVAVIADHPDGVSDSLDFPGNVGDYLDTLATQAWDGVGNDFTCSCWVHEDVTEGYVMMSWGTSAIMFRLRIVFDDPEFEITDDAQTTTITATNFGANATPINVWYHIVGTYDSATDTAEVFVDGVSQDTTTDAAFTTLESSAQPFAIGARANGADPINAKLFQAAIWDTVLDSDQISTLYNSGNGGTYSDFYTAQIGTNPTTTNLFAWWKLEDVNDAHGSNTLTNNGTTTFTAGYNDNAGTFNGSSQYLSATANSVFPTGAQTWACFFKPGVAGLQDILSWLGDDGQRALNLVQQADGIITCNLTSDGTTASTGISAASTTTVPSGQWAHLAVVFVPSTSLTLYIDGIQEDQETTSVPASIHNSTADFCIGARDTSTVSRYCDGQIDDACIFDKALSADEVRWLVHNSYADL